MMIESNNHYKKYIYSILFNLIYTNGVVPTAILSIAHSSTPLLILKNPSSPQLAPQLFLTIQYFSPVALSSP